MKNLKRLRKALRFNQEVPAEWLHVSVAQYSRYERGVSLPDAGHLRVLADRFGISVDFLIANEPCREDTLLSHIETLQRDI